MTHLSDFAQDIRIQFIMTQHDAPILVLTDERYHSDLMFGSYVVALLMSLVGFKTRDWNE